MAGLPCLAAECMYQEGHRSSASGDCLEGMRGGTTPRSAPLRRGPERCLQDRGSTTLLEAAAQSAEQAALRSASHQPRRLCRPKRARPRCARPRIPSALGARARRWFDRRLSLAGPSLPRGRPPCRRGPFPCLARPRGHSHGQRLCRPAASATAQWGSRGASPPPRTSE
eukprot:scaffold610_cov102-Isochrysis_galbana.AAC.3